MGLASDPLTSSASSSWRVSDSLLVGWLTMVQLVVFFRSGCQFSQIYLYEIFQLGFKRKRDMFYGHNFYSSRNFFKEDYRQNYNRNSSLRLESFWKFFWFTPLYFLGLTINGSIFWTRFMMIYPIICLSGEAGHKGQYTIFDAGGDMDELRALNAFQPGTTWVSGLWIENLI